MAKRATDKSTISFLLSEIAPDSDLAVDAALELPWLAKALGSAGKPGEEPGSFSGRLTRTGQDVLVRGRLQVSVLVECVACLNEVPLAVKTELSLLLEPKKRSEARRNADDYEFTAGEAELDVYDGETIVLDGFIRDAILLEIPGFPRCRESCPGLMPILGPPDEKAAYFEDPRLAPLKAFRSGDGPATVEDLIAAAAERSGRDRGSNGKRGRNRAVIRSNQHRPGKSKAEAAPSKTGSMASKPDPANPTPEEPTGEH